jgi:hypothetical protein
MFGLFGRGERVFSWVQFLGWLVAVLGGAGFLLSVRQSFEALVDGMTATERNWASVSIAALLLGGYLVWWSRRRFLIRPKPISVRYDYYRGVALVVTNLGKRATFSAKGRWIINDIRDSTAPPIPLCWDRLQQQDLLLNPKEDAYLNVLQLREIANGPFSVEAHPPNCASITGHVFPGQSDQREVTGKDRYSAAFEVTVFKHETGVKKTVVIGFDGGGLPYFMPRRSVGRNRVPQIGKDE